MAKRPKTVGDLIKVLSSYNQDFPVQIELIKNHGKDSLYGEIDDVYRGEDIMTDDETVFIRFED
jgi:hypothetical protein